VQIVIHQKGWLDKHIHVVTGLALFAALLFSAYMWPALTESAVQSFGTVGLFLTLYGVVFSVIEVRRTKSASEKARIAAERTERATHKAYDIRDISECQTCLETAVHSLSHGGLPRVLPLGRIIRLYTAIFEDRYQDPLSPERRRISIIQSYHGSRVAVPKGDDRLQATLSEMLADLSAHGGRIAKQGEAR
jgi:hypothetical protein